MNHESFSANNNSGESKWDDLKKEPSLAERLLAESEEERQNRLLRQAEEREKRETWQRSREEYKKELDDSLYQASMRERAETEAWRQSHERLKNVLESQEYKDYINTPKVAYEDPDKYRMETTGTSNSEIANVVTEATKFDYNPKGINQIIDKIIESPSAVQKMLELRMRRTSDFMEGVGDYKKEAVATDVNFVLNLAGKGFDFKDFKVDLNTSLGGEPKIVDFSGMIDWYNQGLLGLKAKGKDTYIEATPSPDIPVSKMDATEALQRVKDYYE